MKNVQIRSCFWSVFSLNAGKYGLETTPYLDIFHVVLDLKVLHNRNSSRILKCWMRKPFSIEVLKQKLGSNIQLAFVPRICTFIMPDFRDWQC